MLFILHFSWKIIQKTYQVEAAAFIKQILLGVKHLHSLHIVHLDIKV